MNKQESDTVDQLFREGTPLGTSVLLQMNYNLTKIMMLELERLIKSKSVLNLASWRALMCLSQLGASSQKTMVEFARVDQAQMSRALSLLEKYHYVSSEQCEKDKRARVYSITQAGDSYRKEILPVVEQFHLRLNESLTEEETKTYTSLIKKIALALS